jgi:hypothetical protein
MNRENSKNEGVEFQMVEPERTHSGIFSESAVSLMNENYKMVFMAQLLDAGEQHSPKPTHQAQI